VLSAAILGNAHAPRRGRLPHERGMTLIELVIGLVLVGIVLAIGLPDLSLWLANSRIRTAAESIQDGLRFARGEALRLNTPVRFQITAATSDWTVCIPVTPASTDCVGAQVLQQHSGQDAVNGIAVGGWTAVQANYAASTTSGTPNGVTFGVLGAAGAAGDLVRIDVTNPAIAANAGMRWLVVNVSAGGQVLMCDPSPSLPATSPMHCL